MRDYVDRGGPLSLQGAEGIIEDCERELARRFCRRHALLCSSGTMALYSAYFALDIRAGDEIVCPTVTYHATASPALHFGARVVLVDVEPDTGNISVEEADAAIGPRTRAVVSNATWGHPVAQRELQELCDRRGVAWIEDVSHAHLATYEGRPAGSFGTITCASLQGPKLITGGEGGVLLTDDPNLYARAVLLGHNLTRSEELTRGTPFEPLGRTGYGLKLRAHPLAAVLIHDQLLHHADRWVEGRRRLLGRISEALTQLPGVRPPVIRPTTTSMGAWYGYKPWLDARTLGISRERIVHALRAEGLPVEVRAAPALHDLALFASNAFPIGGFEKYDGRLRVFPNAESYLGGIVSVPTLTLPEDEPIVDMLIEGFGKVWSALEALRR